jgi:hypothetical protein
MGQDRHEIDGEIKRPYRVHGKKLHKIAKLADRNGAPPPIASELVYMRKSLQLLRCIKIHTEGLRWPWRISRLLPFQVFINLRQ